MGYKFSIEHTRSRLYRATQNKRLAGICGGIAEYFDISASIVRMAWIFAFIFFNALAFAAYILLWLLLPQQPNDLYLNETEEQAWRKIRSQPGKSVKSLTHHFAVLEKRLQHMETHVTSSEFKMDQELKRS